MKKLIFTLLMAAAFNVNAQKLELKKVYMVFEFNVYKTSVENNLYAFYYIDYIKQGYVFYHEAEWYQPAEQWYISEKLYAMDISKMRSRMIKDSGPLVVKNNTPNFDINYSNKY